MLRRSSNVGMAFLETQLIGDERCSKVISSALVAPQVLTSLVASGIVRSLGNMKATGGNMAFGQDLAIPFIRLFAHTLFISGTMVTHFMVSKGGQATWPTKERYFCSHSFGPESLT